MRKTILMGLGLAVALAGTAAAQQGGQEAPKRSKVERGNHGRFDKRGGAPDGFLLRGITLNDAQKVQLQELRKSERAKLKANREDAKMTKTQMAEAREARQRGDTAARAIAQRHRLVMAREREQHVAAVRNILTAEQRVQFDKNLAELK